VSSRRNPRWLAIACLTLAGASARGEGGITLDQLMATLRSVPHFQARYIERRTLAALRSPIESRGDLRFQAPDRLEKTTDPGPNGPGERMTIAGNRLTIDRGSAGPPVDVSLSAHPELGALVDSMRATLSGDGAALGRSFQVGLTGTLDDWQLLLQPRTAAQREILAWMRIEGHGARVTAVATEDHDGDRSDMSIVERPP
jgi:hypothetical protein